MTPIEISEALKQIRLECGPRTDVLCGVSDGRYRGRALKLTIYVDGVCKNSTVDVESDDWDDLLAKARREMASAIVAQRGKKIKTMALDIIRITFDQGKCTDLAMIEAGHMRDELKLYGSEAERAADEMSGGRPFKIISTAAE